MAIVYDRLMALDIPEVRQSWIGRDAMFYALSIGLGLDPVDPNVLPYVCERQQAALPTLPIVLGWPGSWLSRPETGVDYLKVVHGEHELRLHRTPAASGTLTAKIRIADIVDKGEGKGALIVSETTQRDGETGDLLATIRQTTFARGDGGFGGPTRPSEKPEPLPVRAPDHVFDHRTTGQTALLYRLNADLNPLHADPEVARRAGFARPILHGLATFGIAGWALLRTVCEGDPARFGAMSVRFTAPVFPGETIRTEIWRLGDAIRFQARAVERDLLALGNGRFEFRG